MERLVSLLGLATMLALAWSMSRARWRVDLRVVIGGLVLQVAFAWLTLKTAGGLWFFQTLGGGFHALLGFVREAVVFIFGVNNPAAGARDTLASTIAFGVLPSIVFFSSLMSILYYLGVMQRVVWLMAIIMQRVMGTSGAESLSAAANVFVGQTEAPLLVKPFLASMTRSELMAVMVGGFATIAGGVMAVYISFQIDAVHLLTASLISAPAALVVAKIMQPEIEQPSTLGTVSIDVDRPGSNVIEAATIGARDGMWLAINVAAMLIAFVALIAMINAILLEVGRHLGATEPWTLQGGLGYVFAPFAWLIGVESNDCLRIGQLFGTRTVLNEFLAYRELSLLVERGEVAPRSALLATYALCGFCNFGSIGIQIGGIGAMVPERQRDVAQLGLRAMIGGTLACFMTACVVGLLS